VSDKASEATETADPCVAGAALLVATHFGLF
jgi:hypothetical protein